MQFTQQNEADGTSSMLNGSFTFKDHNAFRTLLDGIKTTGGARHVLDLSQLDFIDSAALGMLLIALDEAKIGGWSLILRHPRNRVAKLIEVTAMDELFVVET